MIRNLLLSIWILSVTLAASYIGQGMENRGTAAETVQPAKAPMAIKLKTMTVPAVTQGALQGYVLTDIAVLVRPDLLKTLPQPPELLLNDEIFKTIYGEEQIDFKRMEKIDLTRLSQKIRLNINNRANAAVAEDVYIQELHYMSREDARAARR